MTCRIAFLQVLFLVVTGATELVEELWTRSEDFCELRKIPRQ